MKNLLALFFFIFITLSGLAQAPQKFSYQTVIRNASNQLLVGQTVGIKISILQGSANGSAVYAETHTPQTNANGLATLEIGGGSLLNGNFANINYANGLFFVKTETDPNGGNNYTITNTSQLLSVPYALYAAKAPDQQQLSVSLMGDTLFLQNGGFVIIPGLSSSNNGNSVIGPLNIETALIPAGTFTMGSPTNEPQRQPLGEEQYQVTLSAYRMSKYEISNAQFANFLNSKSIGIDGLYTLGAYPTQVLIYADTTGVGYGYGLTYSGSQWQPVAGKENFPAVYVTWYGATEFATYAGGRLPTEAEWEYACRGGTTTPFNTGNCLDYTQANYSWDYPYSGCTNLNTEFPFQTLPVNSYSPNAFGLYNMHGNVWEWCADWFGLYPTTAQTNPTGASTSSWRVLRGGSWGSQAQYCRSAYRFSLQPGASENGGFILGFRLAFAP
jgi:formylglycine-generating enzyme required for sulfatase activity